MSAFGPPVGGLRTLRIVVVLIAFGTIANTGGNVLSLVLNGNRVDQINEERTRNTAVSCERESGQNRAIMAFLRQRHARGEVLKDAERFFPVREPGECAALARRQVSRR